MSCAWGCCEIFGDSWLCVTVYMIERVINFLKNAEFRGELLVEKEIAIHWKRVSLALNTGVKFWIAYKSTGCHYKLYDDNYVYIDGTLCKMSKKAISIMMFSFERWCQRIIDYEWLKVFMTNKNNIETEKKKLHHRFTKINRQYLLI